jgi:hypothetical protein
MPGTGGNVYVDLPGFTGDYADDHSAQVSGAVSASAGLGSTSSPLKVAWLIIVVALVLLWALGWTFR